MKQARATVRAREFTSVAESSPLTTSRSLLYYLTVCWGVQPNVYRRKHPDVYDNLTQAGVEPMLRNGIEVQTAQAPPVVAGADHHREKARRDQVVLHAWRSRAAVVR